MEYYYHYCKVRSRLNKFKLSTDPEMIKTVSLIEALMNRAVALHNGAAPKGLLTPYTNVYTVDLMEWAERYIDELEQGRLPFYGKFTEPGFCMSDHSLIEKDGRMHIFYNRVTAAYPWWEVSVDTVGHAVSDDLIHWEYCPVAVATSNERYDSYQTWAPAVIDKDGIYYMFYAGGNDNAAQAICLATSSDLYKWEVVASPVFAPGEWSGWTPNGWSDARDPMIIKDDDGIYYMYYCTNKKVGDKLVSAMGVASSKDLLHWEDLGASTELGTERAQESPYMIKRNGRYYLFFTDCDRHGTAYAVSDNPLNGWQIKPGAEHMIKDDYVCASEVFEFKGRWYMSYAKWYIGELLGLIGFCEVFWEDDGIRLGRDLSDKI